MKKLILFLVATSLVSCKKDVQPIEKYQGKGYVVIEQPVHYYSDGNYLDVTYLKVKTKDTIMVIYIPKFDGEGLKVGDTLK